MTTIAIAMMILSMLIIWLGLILSTIHLMKNPDESSGLLSKFSHVSDADLQEE